jgi:anti-sigma factor RsiW
VGHLTQKQLEAYTQQQLSPVELLSLSDHLGGCEACQGRLEGALSPAFFALHAEALSENGSATAHLTTEQTAEYVDRNLDGESLQIVKDHLSACELCAVAAADLRAFRNEIAPSIDREYSPAPFPLPAKSSWRRKFVGFFKVSPVPSFAGAALAVLLLIAIGWFVWRTPREGERQIAVAPTPLPQPSASTQPESMPQPQAAPIVAQLNDGNGTLSLDQEGKLSGADELPAAYQSLVKRALTSQRIEKSTQLQGLTRPSSSLMGDGQKQEFSVLEPVGDVLLSDRPTFRWSNMEGGSGYVVEVYDEQFKLVASSPQLNGLSWSATQALPRGSVYSWQVKATKDGQEITSPLPPAPQAKFRVLDRTKAAELAQVKRAYPSSHLTLGLLYAEAGLLKDAEREFRLLRNANPNSDLARTLLRQVQALQH